MTYEGGNVPHWSLLQRNNRHTLTCRLQPPLLVSLTPSLLCEVGADWSRRQPFTCRLVVAYLLLLLPAYLALSSVISSWPRSRPESYNWLLFCVVFWVVFAQGQTFVTMCNLLFPTSHPTHTPTHPTIHTHTPPHTLTSHTLLSVSAQFMSNLTSTF